MVDVHQQHLPYHEVSLLVVKDDADIFGGEKEREYRFVMKTYS